MPVSIEEFVDEPIVTFRFEEVLDAETAHEANEEALNMLAEMGSYYAVLDLRDLPMLVKDALRMLKAQGDGEPDMISHPRIHYVVVSRRATVGSGSNVTGLKGVPEPLVFSKADDAVDHIRIMIATRAYRMQQNSGKAARV
jgi:hypothetical protein